MGPQRLGSVPELRSLAGFWYVITSVDTVLARASFLQHCQARASGALPSLAGPEVATAAPLAVKKECGRRGEGLFQISFEKDYPDLFREDRIPSLTRSTCAETGESFGPCSSASSGTSTTRLCSTGVSWGCAVLFEVNGIHIYISSRTSWLFCA